MNITINESELPDDFIDRVANNKGVTPTELDALRLALQGLSGPEISEQLKISQAAVRKRLGESYRKFEISGSKNKKIFALKKIFAQEYQSQQQNQALKGENHKTEEDLGEAVDVEDFRGRKEEIRELTQWIVDQKCRLVSILGLGGMGKTILAAKIAQEVRSDFDYVIWRSLRNSPKLDDILTEILVFLSDGKNTNLNVRDVNCNQKILRLVQVLRKHRCLIILDNAESLLSSSEDSKNNKQILAGKYKEKEYENYGYLFKKIAEISHHSCLLLTSREKPLQVAMLEGKKLPVKVLHLKGLNVEDARAILQDKGMTDINYSQEQFEKLVKLYSGNPLALKMVATTLYDLFNNNINEFFSQIGKERAVYGDILNLLEEQFNRLSPLEKHIMYWVAIDRDYVSLAQIKQDLKTADRMGILEAVESLLRRSLIEKVAGVGARRFTQQSVVMEYVTQKLINQAREEIYSGEVNSFQIVSEYPLIKARSLDHFRQSQEQEILQPLIKRLSSDFTSKEELVSRFQYILNNLRTLPPKDTKYAAGNIINLLRQLKIDLSDWDFSKLTIWQAYLKDVKLNRAKFTNSDLTGSVFRDTMSSLVSVSFNHDGKYFATGVLNGEVRLWQTDGIKQLKILREHTAWVWTLAFSPDGKTLASGSADYKIKLWDINSGECLHTLTDHENTIYSVAFNADGSKLVSASEDQTIKIWDVKTGKCDITLTEHTGWVWSVKFHPQDANIIASCSADGSIKLWNIHTGKCLQTLLKHYGDVYAIDFHPHGQLLVSCGIDQTIKLWDLTTGNCQREFHAHDRKIYKVSFSQDGNLIASCSEDQTIKLWDAENCECLRTLSGHSSQVWDIAFHPSGRTILSCSDDQTARVWDLKTGNCWNVLQGYTRDVYSLAFSPDGKILASGRDDRTIRLWELNHNYKCHPLEAHQGRIRSVAFSPDGQTLASGSADRLIKLWDIQDIGNGREIQTLKGHENWVWSVVFSPDGQTLASSSEDRTIRLWNIKTGKCVRVFTGHTHWVWIVAFSPNGKTLASGSADSTVKLWDAATGKCITTLDEHKDLVWSVAFSPDGKTLATGSEDRTIKIWDLSTYQCLYTLNNHTQQVYSVVFSPDGKTLASGSGDTTVKLWQVKTGKLLNTLKNGHTEPIRCVAFSPDGKLLASGGEDEKIQLWDLENCDRIKQLNSHRFYEGMEITNIKGLTYPELASLKALGAVVNCNHNLASS